MYGTNFQLEQSLTTKRYSTLQMENANLAPIKTNKGLFFLVILLLGAMTISASSYAGSSQPKIAGGNGNANGR